MDSKLEDRERGSELPCLVNLQPSGEFLMEDFYCAGGLPAVLREFGQAQLLHPPTPQRGWYELYVDSVQQANLGADLEFLVGPRGAAVPWDSH